jgi:hypothetical protein
MKGWSAVIVKQCFHGYAIWMQEIQHDLYWSNVGLIVKKAKELFCYCETVIGIETEIGNEIKFLENFDHRTLQYLYDVIAADYRYQNLENQGFCFEQIGLTELIANNIKTSWLKFYSSKIDDLYKNNAHLPKQVLTAALYPNPDKRGMAAEDYIYDTVSYCFKNEIYNNDVNLQKKDTLVNCNR